MFIRENKFPQIIIVSSAKVGSCKISKKLICEKLVPMESIPLKVNKRMKLYSIFQIIKNKFVVF